MKKTKAVPLPKRENTRKAMRKQKRQQKKVHRQEHYMKKNVDKRPNQNEYTPGKFVKRPVELPEKTVEVKKKKPKLETPLDILGKERLQETKVANKLKNQMDKRRKEMLVKANEDEDRTIKKLEKQLGLNKSKNKNKNFSNDGLDYLLEICDRATTEQIVAAEKHLAEVDGDSDFEEDLAAVTGKSAKSKNNKTDESDSADENSDISGDDIDENDDESLDDESLEEEEMGEDKEISGNDNDESESDFDDQEDDSDQEPEEKPAKVQKNKANIIKASSNVNKTKEKDNTVSKKEKVVSEKDLSKIFSDDEVSHLSSDDDEMMSEAEDDQLSNVEENTVVKEKPDIWEDIYGRKRDKEGNVIKEEKGVYIPPHLRNKDSSSDKQLILLKRQVKSVLNKLSGTNLHWACTSIEQLYSSNSRHAVSSTLCQAWQDACCGDTSTADRLVAEHAALLAVLHANVGSEIGAHFLQELTKQFDEIVDIDQPVENKRLDNLVSCLAHMYTFKIYHAPLVYDMLTRLVQRVSERRVGSALVVLRCGGAALRRDEPLLLKDYVLSVQEACANNTQQDGSRLKFLMEILMAVKNNNLTKIPNYDPSYTEQLKKNIKGIIRKGNYITSLNIRLQDLLKADERGKWWVVGSAWEGNITRTEEKTPAKLIPTNDQKLLELARKQRMNTDVRRSIFCVIMSAEDYMDAFEKLQHLGLRAQQQREVVHVLLACCLQEKTFNPYYALLGLKLAQFDRKYQLAIQYSVWDKIKELDTTPKQAATNLAQFLLHLIVEKGLPLSVLKVIQFSELNKHSVRFMRQILLAIIMNADLQSSLEAFHRIAKSPKLHMFRESIRLFIQHFLIKNAGKKNNVLSDEEMVVLKQRALEVEKILTSHESKFQF